MRTLSFSLALGLYCLLTSLPAMGLTVNDWKPVDATELALKSPIVEKDADAEALFWEVRVADEIDGGTPRRTSTTDTRLLNRLTAE